MQSFEKGDVVRARELNKVMVPQADSMFLVSNPPHQGSCRIDDTFYSGPYRLPLCPMTAEERQKVHQAWKETGLLK